MNLFKEASFTNTANRGRIQVLIADNVLSSM